MSYPAISVSLACILIACTLFFSVSGIALQVFSRVRLLDAFKASKRCKSPEQLTDSLVANREKLILTCRIFRLISNMAILLLALTMCTELREAPPQFIDYLITVIISGLIISVFSLAIPHAWAKYAGEKLLSKTYKPILFFASLTQPVLYLHGFTDAVIRCLAGVAETTARERQEEKQEEFLNGLEQRTTEGVLDKEQQQMIENVLELNETTADEIMTPRTDIVAIDVNSERQTVLETITRAGHSRVPVYDDNIDRIIGLIYAKDLLAETSEADFKLRDKLRTVYFVPETKPIRSLLHEFQNQKLHIAILLDEYGGTAGIVTLEDILEELVGEITDEYEEPSAAPIKKIDANTIEVDARTNIDDLNDQLHSKLPEDEDYDTVGGFVFSHLGYIPKAGLMFDYNGLDFTIISAEPRRIKRIRIKQPTDR